MTPGASLTPVKRSTPKFLQTQRAPLAAREPPAEHGSIRVRRATEQIFLNAETGWAGYRRHARRTTVHARHGVTVRCPRTANVGWRGDAPVVSVGGGTGAAVVYPPPAPSVARWP